MTFDREKLVEWCAIAMATANNWEDGKANPRRATLAVFDRPNVTIHLQRWVPLARVVADEIIRRSKEGGGET